MNSHAPRAWLSEANLYAPRKPRHRLASLGNPERKNTPCISALAGVKFILKKERVFFFRGSALQVFWQCGGASIRTRFCENYFLGVWIFAKPRQICFWILSARRKIRYEEKSTNSSVDCRWFCVSTSSK